MYHVLEGIPFDIPGGVHFEGSSGYSGVFFEGSPVNSCEIFVKLESGKIDLPDYFELFCTPVVSADFVELLSAICHGSFQSIPAEVRFENLRVQGYHVLNVLRKVEVLNMENTRGNVFKNKIVRMKQMKISEQVLQMNFPMFRVSEFPTVIIINEEVVKRIESSGFTGCVMMAADGWGDSHRF